MHTNYLGILLNADPIKCRFWFLTRVGPEILHFYKLPEDAAGPWPHTLSQSAPLHPFQEGVLFTTYRWEMGKESLWQDPRSQSNLKLAGSFWLHTTKKKKECVCGGGVYVYVCKDIKDSYCPSHFSNMNTHKWQEKTFSPAHCQHLINIKSVGVSRNVWEPVTWEACSFH